ncbi:MAG: mammalian cell entry protein [Mycobacterium sp.]|nr:mammalian cell entry protein [Mycobacterium sp.]
MSETLGSGQAASEGNAPPRRFRLVGSLAAVLAALAVLNLWGLYRDQQARGVERRNASMVQAAREGLTNLTTVDYQHADADVQRILNSSTGEFREDFATNSASFIAAARKAESTSVGTVSAAGLESASPDLGRVLVALTVMTSNRGLPENQPRNWRTRVTVTRSGGDFKLAAVEFVP